MKTKITAYTKTVWIVCIIFALQATTLLAQEDTVVEEAVDGNTRGIMLLVLLLGLGMITFIGFYMSATEGQDAEEQS